MREMTHTSQFSSIMLVNKHKNVTDMSLLIMKYTYATGEGSGEGVSEGN